MSHEIRFGYGWNCRPRIKLGGKPKNFLNSRFFSSASRKIEEKLLYSIHFSDTLWTIRLMELDNLGDTVGIT
jgi:hypothetical protein